MIKKYNACWSSLFLEKTKYYGLSFNAILELYLNNYR